MAKNILKEAIADAKAVREVALANAKAALEEAFTPKLQSMLSAKLSETLNEEEELEETVEEVEEAVETVDEGENLDEEIDLEEILNELELEEGEAKEKTVDEADDKDLDEAKEETNEADDKDLDEVKIDEDKEEVEEAAMVNPQASDVSNVDYGTKVHEGEAFDLDALLEEINNLDENEDEVNEEEKVDEEMKEQYNALVKENADLVAYLKELTRNELTEEANKVDVEELKSELKETKKAFETVKSELNEVNLLNSKLLYVNRIFKANTLDEAQKLRVVETLDNASNIKEAKLIYETIKDTFTVAKSKKASFKNKTKSLKEGIGMASKAAGTSTAPKKEVISESNDMMKRFQKLANIKINQ